MFIYRFDETFLKFAQRMGIRAVPLELDQAGPAYDAGRIDGFITVPTAALAFQWLSQARYFTELETSMEPACVVLTRRAFDTLPLSHQAVVREAMARLDARFEDIGRRVDEHLLRELLEKQGLRRVPVSPSFRTEFRALAREAREKGGQPILPVELLGRVQSWLADDRADFPAPRR
jgi:TRAP-type C4-dicarboxylate transport system substrate-binding protein